MNLGMPIAKGNTAQIYLSNDKIVKVFNDGLPETEAENEARKQRYAASCNLPVPKILEVTHINGKQAIIMEYIQGETLADLLLKDPKQIANYLSVSVDLQMEIHRIKPIYGEIEPMHDKLSRQIDASNSLSTNQKTTLLEQLDSFTYENRLCHGDFHLFNLIQSNQQVVVIDWVDATAGDIRADVYRTYLLYLQAAPELAELYLQLYCEKSGLSQTEVLQWAPVIAGARLSEGITTDQTEQLMKIIRQA